MKNAHIFSLLTALMLVLALALTACGGGASSAAPASAASATDTTTPAGSASVPAAPEEPAADPITFSGALRYSDGSNGSANSAGYYQIVTRAEGVVYIEHAERGSASGCLLRCRGRHMIRLFYSAGGCLCAKPAEQWRNFMAIKTNAAAYRVKHTVGGGLRLIKNSFFDRL